MWRPSFIKCHSEATAAFGKSVDPEVSFRTTDSPYEPESPRSASFRSRIPELNFLSWAIGTEIGRSVMIAVAPIRCTSAAASASVASPSGNSAAPKSMQATTTAKKTGWLPTEDTTTAPRPTPRFARA